MSASSIFGLIYAIMKAVPVVNGWVQSFLTFLVTKKIEEHRGAMVTRDREMAVILKKIMESESHEERAILLTTLGRLERVQQLDSR